VNLDICLIDKGLIGGILLGDDATSGADPDPAQKKPGTASLKGLPDVSHQTHAMISKAIIKDIQNLARREFREAQKLFLAEGEKWMDELLRHTPAQIQCIYATQPWLDAHVARLTNIPHEAVDASMLERLSQLKTPPPVLAVVRQFQSSLQPAMDGIHLLLDTIQDPGNLGTLIRTADWFGVRQVICSPDCADVYNPKVVQSTMGSLVRVPVVYTDLAGWLSRQTGIPKWAAVLSGNDYTTLSGSGILMMGNESKGLSEELAQLATVRVTVPRFGGAESLNVAVATGVLLAQLRR